VIRDWDIGEYSHNEEAKREDLAEVSRVLTQMLSIL
jgi:hypothetical protein